MSNDVLAVSTADLKERGHKPRSDVGLTAIEAISAKALEPILQAQREHAAKILEPFLKGHNDQVASSLAALSKAQVEKSGIAAAFESLLDRTAAAAAFDATRTTSEIGERIGRSLVDSATLKLARLIEERHSETFRTIGAQLAESSGARAALLNNLSSLTLDATAELFAQVESEAIERMRETLELAIETDLAPFARGDRDAHNEERANPDKRSADV